jgi:hypothetical protein
MNDNDQIFRECGPGWKNLIDPLIDKANELGVTVDQVKEKNAGLRFYYTPGDTDDTALADMVDDAELASFTTCEMCGMPGITLKRAGWYKTLCKIHAIEFGYKEKA